MSSAKRPVKRIQMDDDEEDDAVVHPATESIVSKSSANDRKRDRSLNMEDEEWDEEESNDRTKKFKQVRTGLSKSRSPRKFSGTKRVAEAVNEVQMVQCDEAPASKYLSGIIKGHARNRSVANCRTLLYKSALNVFRGTGNFKSISGGQLRRIYELIDEHFLCNQLSNLLREESRQICFRVSNRMTRRAGQLYTDRRQPKVHELGISSFLLFQSFVGNETKAVTVNGIPSKNRLECLLRIMEHELVHLMFCCKSLVATLGVSKAEADNIESSHGPIFQLAVQNLFGHTHWQHELTTVDEKAFLTKGINVGSIVKFEWQNALMVGKVNRVQKRVTVLVQDKAKVKHAESREFSDGNYYRKFYIPVELCELVK